MQIIRSSQGCRWIQDCEACGCLFIYSGQDIQEEEIEHDDLENIKQKLIAVPVRHVVECPECHYHVRIQHMAKYRKPAAAPYAEEEDWI